MDFDFVEKNVKDEQVLHKCALSCLIVWNFV